MKENEVPNFFQGTEIKSVFLETKQNPKLVQNNFFRKFRYYVSALPIFFKVTNQRMK